MADKKLRDPFYQQDSEQRTADKRFKEDLFKESLIHVLSTEHGRNVFARLFVESGLFSSVFDSDPLVMAYKAGKEDFAKTVMQLVMKHCPQYFQELKGN